jgi:hypothetical protein
MVGSPTRKNLTSLTSTALTSASLTSASLTSAALTSASLTSAALMSMGKKYHVSVSGSKKEMAITLWRVGGSFMSTDDLKLIIGFLPKEEQKQVEKILKRKPISNYKGMWRPKPKKMNRVEMIQQLRKFRDAWEKVTKRNQDLDDERLENETDKGLRALLAFYYSEEAKNLAAHWL